MVLLPEPPLPRSTRIGYGPRGWRSMARYASTMRQMSSSRVTNVLNSSRVPPRSGTGSGSIPFDRMKWIGVTLQTFQPPGAIRTLRHSSSQTSR